MNYTALAAGTVLIVLFSWFLSLRYGRYHGIPRLFAFESILILVLLNLHGWFRDPFSIRQIFSWLFLFSSFYPAIAGYLLLRRKGRPDANFENTSKLVTAGLYGYIRHPLYLSIFLLGTGVMLKNPGPAQIILALVNTAALFFTAKVEEGEMIRKFGSGYREYMKTTRMFIPFVL
jgi:protein-S-isoprenylcysteine O-methyltransferase Ste14